MRWIQFFRSKRRLVLILILLFLLAFSQYPRLRADKRDTAVATRKDIREELVLSGEIDADEHVTLSFQTSGLLSWVGVKENERVKKYQGIAALDVRLLRKNLEKELNDYLASRWDLDQVREDNEGKIVTDKIKRILEKAQYDLNNSVIDVELQQLSIDLATLSTPIAGVVTRVSHPFSGVNVTPTTAQFEIFNPETVSFRVTADQSEVVGLSDGMPVTVTLDAYPQASIAATIARISYQPRLDETGTVYDVWLDITALTDASVRLGMTGDARFVISEKSDTVIVPSRFVKSDGEGTYVLVGRSEKRRIETGIETETEIEVVFGIIAGDVVYD